MEPQMRESCSFGRDERRLRKMLMDLGGVQPRECLFEAIDLLNGRIREHPGGALVGTFLVMRST